MSLSPADPNVHAEDVPRLSQQCHDILAMLRKGPATSHQLAMVALKYTSRISDLRAAGYDVRCRRAGNQSIYTLAGEPDGSDK